MADSKLYLDSLKSMSLALEKMLALEEVKKQIKAEYERIPKNNGSDSKVMLDALVKVFPIISNLQEQEKLLKSEIAEQISKSLNNALAFIKTYDLKDFEDEKMSGIEKHFQILYDVITSHSVDIDSISIKPNILPQTLEKLDPLRENPMANRVIEKIEKINLLIVSHNVGKE